jgi:hypothetical protein
LTANAFNDPLNVITSERFDINQLSVAVSHKNWIKGASEIIDQVDQVVGRWREYADDQKVDPELRNAIEGTLVKMNQVWNDKK